LVKASYAWPLLGYSTTARPCRCRPSTAANPPGAAPPGVPPGPWALPTAGQTPVPSPQRHCSGGATAPRRPDRKAGFVQLTPTATTQRRVSKASRSSSAAARNGWGK
jgi:hypothetical protein